MEDLKREFTIHDIQMCLFDEKRVDYFRRAIESVVRNGDTVVDAGSGSGIFGLLAARCGAKKVYCVELNERYCQVIEENAKRNNLENQIVILNEDATEMKLPEKVDVIIAEVISGGFFFEPQVQIINNLRKYLKSGGKIIPQEIQNYVELVDAQEDISGLKFNYESRYKELKDKSLSSKTAFSVFDFTEFISPKISEELTVQCKRDGVANAIRVPYTIKLTDGVSMLKSSPALLNAEVVFLKEPLEVEKNKNYRINLNYLCGTDTLDADITVRELTDK